MDVKYQIFVSSTFDDLKEERRKVIEQILNLGHIPVGMELFQAGDETQWDLIKRRISECDYYIVIVAERYGAEGPAKKSYTRMEYEYALKSKVPTIAFLLHKDARASWPASKTEFEHKAKIQDFRDICQKKIVQFWHNGDDLAAKVATSITQQIQVKPRIGWIRADRAASIDTVNEFARLSEEKRNLQLRISELESQNQGLRTPAEIAYQMEALSNLELSDYVDFKSRSAGESANVSFVSLIDYFMSCSRSFAGGVNKWKLAFGVGEFLGLPQDYYDVDDALAEFQARDLIAKQYVTKHSSGKTSSEAVYHLTDRGKSLILHIERQNV